MFVICISLLLIGLLGCAKENIPLSKTQNESRQSGEAPATAENKVENLIVPSKEPHLEPQASDFKEAVNIDFSKYQKDFLTIEILDILKNNLESIINRDKEDFNRNMSENYKKSNSSLIENQNKYMFEDINLAQRDNEMKRINIGIKFLVTLDERDIKRGNMVYTLKENIKGQWEITLIDYDNPL